MAIEASLALPCNVSGTDEVLRRIALLDGVFVTDEGPVRRAGKSDRCRPTARRVIDSKVGPIQVSEDE